MLGRLAFLFGFEWLGSKTWHGVFDGFGGAVGMPCGDHQHFLGIDH